LLAIKIKYKDSPPFRRVFTIKKLSFELCLLDMGPKKIPGSYDHEIAKSYIWRWLFAIIILVVAVSLGAFISLRPKQQSTKTGQDLNNSISSYENRYVGKKIEYNLTNKQNDWVKISNEGGATYKLTGSSCTSSLLSTDNVKSLVNSGSTLASAINKQLEETKDSSPDKTIIIGNTYSANLSFNKGDLEFMIKDADYKAADGTTHKIKIYGQWIGDYQLFIRQDCTVGDFNNSKEKLESFIDSLGIIVN
jgi:hypothetical protein